MTHAEIIKKLEALTGPSREVDGEVHAHLFGGYPAHLCHDVTRRSYGAGGVHKNDDGSNLLSGEFKIAPEYTNSVDACLALVKRLFPGAEYTLTTLYGVAGVTLFLNGSVQIYGRCECGNEPIAICIAIIKAHAHKKEADNA